MVHTIPINIIQIEEEGFHLMVEGLINGKPANFVLDTGASRTVFDKEKIKQYASIEEDELEPNEELSTGLGTSSLESQIIQLNSLQLGELIINEYKAVLLDMQHIVQSYERLDLPTIDAVLGGDILKKYKAVINYKKKELKLTS